MGSAEQRPLGEHLAELKEVGYTVFRGHIDARTLTALRDVLEPVFSAAFEADSAPKLKLGAGSVTGHRAGGSWPGGGLLRHPLWEPTLKPLLHHPRAEASAGTAAGTARLRGSRAAAGEQRQQRAGTHVLAVHAASPRPAQLCLSVCDQ